MADGACDICRVIFGTEIAGQQVTRQGMELGVLCTDHRRGMLRAMKDAEEWGKRARKLWADVKNCVTVEPLGGACVQLGRTSLGGWY